MNNKKTYFISGGGTGGHIYPAFTVVQELLKDSETSKIFFIGNPKNLEYEISQKYSDVTFLPVKITGMPRKLSLSFIKWGFELLFSYFKSLSYIQKYKPDTIFATGGYVSAPIILAAMTKNIPYMIHDCDSVPGLVSKMAAPKAKKVSIAFENSKNILKSKNIIFNGNPVREEFFTISKQEARKHLNIDENKRVIFAMGGSQGAKTINTAMVHSLKNLSQDNNYIILQTGKNKYEEVLSLLDSIYPDYKDNPNILVRPYFDDMVYPLKACDLVIARAGSVSLSEILQCAAASILIPYPYAAQDHQRKNAKEMQDRGTSICIEDSECTSEVLFSKINELLSDNNKIESMRMAAKDFAKTNPTVEIVKQLKSIIQ